MAELSGSCDERFAAVRDALRRNIDSGDEVGASIAVDLWGGFRDEARTVPATLSWVPDEKICFWGGWGGSMIVMDVGRKMTISYMMNNMAPGIIGSPRSEEYGKAIYTALD